MIVSLKRVECVAGRFANRQTTHQPGSVIQEQQQALVQVHRETIRLAQVRGPVVDRMLVVRNWNFWCEELALQQNSLTFMDCFARE